MKPSENHAKIRSATIQDTALILFFITALAKYERLEHEVVATEKKLKQSLFGKNPKAEVLLAFLDTTPIGFALFFSNYSTFLGKAGIHLEDLFILEEHRGYGHGKNLFQHVAQIAILRNAGRLEWNVLDWNKSAIKFYQHLGAHPVAGWTTFRLTGNSLYNLGRTD